MKNQRSILLFGVIFVVLVGVAWMQQRQPEGAAEQLVPTATPAVQLSRVFAELSGSDIAAVRLQVPSSEATLTIQRGEDDAWSAPGLDGQLDAGTAEAIVRTIQLMPYARTLTLEDDANLEDYGFASDASLLIQVILRNGETHGIVVGGLTPSTLNYYAVVDERDEIYLLESGPVKFLLDLTESPPTA